MKILLYAMMNICDCAGLHLLLSQAPRLTSVQCPGSSLLTDQDLLAILDTGALGRLTKLVISQPISVDHRTVPLSQHAVVALHKACPGLSLLGDLKHWDISPPLRYMMMMMMKMTIMMIYPHSGAS